MYETKSKSLWRRMAALCAAAVLALTACVQCAYAQEKTVIPLGQAVGIKLFANGVLVVDVSALEGVGGKSPAQKCGIREGDLLLTFNGKKIASTEHLQELLRQNGTQSAQIELQRGRENKTVEITPACGDDGSVRLGAWIRDSMAGIGTMTYYDPESGSFGALGHGITDIDTAQLMSLGSGSIMETTVKAVKKGEKGEPGELKGDVTSEGSVLLRSNLQSNITAGSVKLTGCTLIGDITANGPVTVSEDSKVTGNITAQSLLCAGEINGDIRISGNTQMDANARVSGSVVTGTISVAAGAVLNGSVEMKGTTEAKS